MFGFGKRAKRRDVTPEELQSMIQRGQACVVDVREPAEFADGHVPGAINLPLSRFDAARLPDTDPCNVVLICAGGIRSAQALRQCADTGVDAHLAGGMRAWMKAGMPVEG
ncbi:rhodanese-related sulfurtransferase [Altererythrobacter atlanticus]|uniref:Adenylyltransferase/sulfurtransferase MoeZ n=1 Tax=Croceibacterium atlanticum TaxID=1267766 RepID=A0A0F7KUF5_9SPHN|nr:rhodanese-like domain-containing protein [Croceibacterium atlanticum]AKH42821.1 putative adenylyltransferase/sulfurtransferase MoeZ [Croceibacterium atlanticum]MBB5731601.1 rhodanese-related sulfurtransferase [Croceibacterium atlanticum]